MKRCIQTLSLIFCLTTLPLSYANAVEGETVQLRRLEGYMNNLTTIVADFTQIAPNGGLASGKFYLKRPKLMRWQYDPPTPILMVTRGSYLTYYDYELEQVSDIPLDSTLLGVLSEPQITFGDDRMEILGIEQEPGVIRLKLTQRDQPEDGTLTLEFNDAPLELKNIHVQDGTGKTTHITLNNARFGIALDDALFSFRDPRIGGNKRNKRW